MNEHDSERKGLIIILNGAPRSGKSSIAAEIQNSFEGIWINLGVDRYMPMIPERYQPGIGLRPGGERPDLEPAIGLLYQALYMSITAHSQIGLNVIADVGHHNDYSAPMNILPHCARILEGYPVLFIGVRCPINEIMRRRANTQYASYDENGVIPKPILLWQQSVHIPGIYDLEVDSSVSTPSEIAEIIRNRLGEGHFMAFHRLAGLI